ncbi:MAG: 1,4-dihydroxy-6-naphthoate synthase [Saprospiraceae bacterium]|nr:1,4-dihydroxy-6-naphthoate synthase [Saprospiraceae bacterium]
MYYHKGKIKLAISPCPNDTFIFGPWINGNIHSAPEISKVSYLDIQELNESAFGGEYDIIKVSAAIADELMDIYNLLSCGAAMGLDCGPILVSKSISSLSEPLKTVAIPGKNTTANFLFNYAYPQVKDKMYMNFSTIEQAVLDNQCSAGVLIHEGRFTYEEKGLHLISDLGTYWVEKTGLPIPLGVILVKKEINVKDIEDIIRSSIRYAESHHNELMPYILKYSNELNENVVKRHISLYVNDLSKDFGRPGRDSLEFLWKIKNKLEEDE